MQSSARVLATALVAFSASGALGQGSAHFWLSTSSAAINGPESPTIRTPLGTGGQLHIWGRPMDGKTLRNFSLDLITLTPTIDLIDGTFVIHNPIEARRFEYSHDSILDDENGNLCDPDDASGICVPELLSTQSVNTGGTLAAADTIVGLGGFSIGGANQGVGPDIGPDSCLDDDYCVIAEDDGLPAWLIASIDYRAVSVGVTEVFLQIGNVGMNHADAASGILESSNSTYVMFGVDPSGGSEPEFNAGYCVVCDGRPRYFDEATNDPEAFITTILPGDYDGSGTVDPADYLTWKATFGQTGEQVADGNGNGVVDAADYTVWRNHFGTTAGSGSASIAVPEPPVPVLVGLGILALAGIRRVAPVADPWRAVRGRRCDLVVLSVALVVMRGGSAGAAGVEFVLKQTFQNPSGPIMGDLFGAATASLGDDLLASSATGNGGDGSVVLMDFASGGELQAFFDVGSTPGGKFGSSHIVASADGSRVLIDAFQQTVGSVTGAGAAYLFNTSDGSLVQGIANPDPRTGDNFGGNLIRVGNDFAIFSATKDIDLDNSANITVNEEELGAVYIYDDDGNLVRQIDNPFPNMGDRFGGRGGPTGTNPNYLLVGARDGDETALNAGSAYLFDISTGQMLETFGMPGSDTPTAGDAFGIKIPHQGVSNANIAVIGADRGGSTGLHTGSAYIYEFDGNLMSDPTLLATITNPNPVAGNRFLGEVEVTDNYVFVGSFQDDTPAQDAGVVHVFDLNTGSLVGSIQHPDPQAGDEFGFRLTTRPDGVFISAQKDDVSGVQDAGSVFFFQIRELVEWTGTTGDWASGANWDTGTPPNDSLNEVAVLANGGAPTISSAVPDVLAMEIENGGVTVTTGGSINVFDDVAIAANGMLIINGASAQLTAQTIVVDGSLTAANNGIATVNGTLTVGPSGNLNAAALGIIQVNGQLTNFNSGTDTLSGGTYAVIGMLQFNDAHIVSNAAHLSLSGPGSAIVDQPDGNALADFASNIAGATFALGNNRDLAVTGSFTNAGAMTLVDSTLTVAGTYTQTGGFTELDNGELVATSIDFQSGTLRGRGTVLGNLMNSGRVAPGFSPEIIVVDGDYTQASDGILDMEIGGTMTAGTDFDQLQVTGTATLAGRLELRRINGYMPEEDDEVPILTAGSVVNEFDSVFFPNAPDGFAVDLLYSSTDVRVKFVAPEDVVYVPTLGVDGWSTAGIWDLGASPKSKNNVTIASDGSDRLITVDVVDAKINRATVSGDTNAMTLEIPTGTTLSAINRLTIGNFGVLRFDGGMVVSANLTVESGGTLNGNGTIVGNLTNSGDLSPGFSTGELVIDGDLTLTSSSTLVIEIEGANPGGYDTVDLSGEATLGGHVIIDLTNAPPLNPGDSVEFLSAGSVVAGTAFDSFEVVGDSDSVIVLMYGGGGASAAPTDPGDLNLDYAPYGPGDAQLLALRLADRDAYDAYLVSRCMVLECSVTDTAVDELPDINADSNVDFDDILAFATNSNMSVAQLVSLIYGKSPSIPEPSSLCLAFTLIPFTLVFQRKSRRLMNR